MDKTFLSSGDVLADRRYRYGEDLAAEGDHAAAADLFEQALELAPAWPAGWFALGRARAEAGDASGAAEAFRQAAALDPDDRLGAGLHAARMAGTAPAAPPAGYVRALFDDYADRFEAALVGRLGYRAPAAIAEALHRHAPGRRFSAALDLGCGTGLMGETIRARVDRLGGVDLAPRMVDLAAAKRIYDALEVADVAAALARRAPAALDLVLAADVFCYLGDLAPVLTAAARALAPGGLLAFTVEWDEAGAEGGGFLLRESLRYAHALGPLERAAAAAGLAVLQAEPVDLRLDRGEPVRGLVCLLAR